FSRRIDVPHVTTQHGRLDLPDLVPLYNEFADMPVVSISNSQRKPLPRINWQGTVYHGFPLDLYKSKSSVGSYLAFMGRVSPEKRLDRAIEIAKRANMKLRIAAKIDPIDQQYMETHIRPLLDHPLIDFVGEIGQKEKSEFLGNAYALVFPIDWEEPFGLVMIEAIACGTPVIAFRRGSVPEVIDDGITGFVVENEDEAVAAIKRLGELDRRRVRAAFEERFTAKKMAQNYIHHYETLLSQRHAQPQKALRAHIEAQSSQHPG